MAETELKTISSVVDENQKKQRGVSVPQGVPQRPILRHTHSHLGHKPPQVPTTIPEVEITDTDPIERPKSTESARSHQIRNGVNNPKKCRSELTLSVNNNNGYENNFYDGPLPETTESDRVSKRSFDSRSNYSNKSSRDPSVLSLQVQREQYCCASKWSPCERKLVAVVGVLASIILILVIVMGILLGSGSAYDEKFNWKL